MFSQRCIDLDCIIERGDADLRIPFASVRNYNFESVWSVVEEYSSLGNHPASSNALPCAKTVSVTLRLLSFQICAHDLLVVANEDVFVGEGGVRPADAVASSATA